MRIIPFMFLAALLIAPSVGARAAEGGSARVRALLVIASKEKGAVDPRLSAYEPNLRQILSFESYRLAGEGSVTLASPGEGSLSLGQGHSLALENQKADRGGVRLQVNWQANGRSFMNTALVLRPGVPVILGGPSRGKGGEVWAVIVIAN